MSANARSAGSYGPLQPHPLSQPPHPLTEKDQTDQLNLFFNQSLTVQCKRCLRFHISCWVIKYNSHVALQVQATATGIFTSLPSIRRESTEQHVQMRNVNLSWFVISGTFTSRRSQWFKCYFRMWERHTVKLEINLKTICQLINSVSLTQS